MRRWRKVVYISSQIFNTRRTKSQNFNGYRLVLQLCLPNLKKPGREWRCSWSSTDRRRDLTVIIVCTLQWRHMSIKATQISRNSTVWSTIYLCKHWKNDQSSALQTLCGEKPQVGVDSPHKCPAILRALPYHDIDMYGGWGCAIRSSICNQSLPLSKSHTENVILYVDCAELPWI